MRGIHKILGIVSVISTVAFFWFSMVLNKEKEQEIVKSVRQIGFL
jgi:uncharacterized membrane protein